LKEKLNKVILPLLIILAGAYFAFYYVENLHRDYYFLFHKTKTNATIINITNYKANSKILKISYYNLNTNQTETCDFVSDFYFANEIQKNAKTNTDIYYTTLNPCDTYIIDYKSPTIGIIILRVLISILIGVTIIIYIVQLLKNINKLIQNK
jgi:hypothetical protein